MLVSEIKLLCWYSHCPEILKDTCVHKVRRVLNTKMGVLWAKQRGGITGTLLHFDIDLLATFWPNPHTQLRHLKRTCFGWNVNNKACRNLTREHRLQCAGTIFIFFQKYHHHLASGEAKLDSKNVMLESESQAIICQKGLQAQLRHILYQVPVLYWVCIWIELMVINL